MAALTSASSSIYTDHVVDVHRVINNICLHELIHSVYTVEPPNNGPLKSGQTPYNGHI